MMSIDLSTYIEKIAKIANEGTCVGRVWVPSKFACNKVAGPRVVTIENGQVFSLTTFLTMRDLLEESDCIRSLKNAKKHPLISLEDLLKNSFYNKRQDNLKDEEFIILLAPNDIQPIKACGVTFIRSLLERVIEEQAKGNAQKADMLRESIYGTIGDNLNAVVPGSPQTDKLKEQFIEKGIWSQYLEVGIGLDAEVFTKAQVLSSVTFGQEIGVLKKSKWNNPEPEVVLVVSSKGVIKGATLGNDVNLRDYEGRSALLLGKAKDNNASCSIGPFIRLIDKTFSLEDISNEPVTLSIKGNDGFCDEGTNLMEEISRSPQTLVNHTISKNHQYPDGFVLFLGTMFAPTTDRKKAGEGFTHHVGDIVEISSPKLGILVNRVNYCEDIAKWNYGIRDLMNFIVETSR